MRPPRIHFLDYTNGIGGGQRSLASLIRHLPRERYQPIMACQPGERFRDLIPPAVPSFDLPLSPAFAAANRLAGAPLSYAHALAGVSSTLAGLRRLLSTRQIDLIHASKFKNRVPAKLASVGRRIPVLRHVRDISREQTAGWLRLGGRAAGRALTASLAVAAQCGNNGRVSVLRNAVELSAELEGRELGRLGFRAGRARAMGLVSRRRRESLFSISAQIHQLTRIYEATYALCYS